MTNGQYKVVTILGTRPEIIKMSQVIKALDTCCDHIIVHTGQNYDHNLNQIFFNELSLRPVDYYLGCNTQDWANAISDIYVKTKKLFEKIKPDAVVVYGDTNSCLAVYVAKRMQIPIFHLEAGNRCFDYRVPEEINRKIVDHLSDVNLVLSQEAKENLIAEGFPRNRIFNIGSNMPEVIDSLKEKIARSSIIQELNIDQKYILVSIHREENVDNDEIIKNIIDKIKKYSIKNNVTCVWSCHPRLKKKLQKLNLSINNKLIKVCEPFGLIDYLKLQSNAKCLISDSGTVSEESSYLNIPTVTIRNAHERLEGMQNGIFVMSERASELEASIDLAINESSISSMKQTYSNQHNSFTVAKIILSYIEYVKREVYKQ